MAWSPSIGLERTPERSEYLDFNVAATGTVSVVVVGLAFGRVEVDIPAPMRVVIVVLWGPGATPLEVDPIACCK